MRLSFSPLRFLFLLPALLLAMCSFAQNRKADSLRPLVRKKPNDLSLNLNLFEAWRKTNPDSAAAQTTRLLVAGEEKGDSLLIGLAYYFKGCMQLDAGKNKESIPFFKKSAQAGQHAKDSAWISVNAMAYRNTGLGFSNSGKPNEAEPYFQEAVAQSAKINDSLGIAITWIFLGQLEKERGNYDKALKVLFDALGIAERRNDAKQAGRCLNNIANVYMSQSKFEDAIHFYERSIEYKKKASSKGDLANSYGNIGVAYYSMNKFDTALQFYRLSLSMKLEAGDTKAAASTVHNIGLLHLEQARYDSAEKYFLRSLDMRNGIGDEAGIASTQNQLANLYVRMGNCGKALTYAENSIALTTKNGAKEHLVIAYKYAAQACACTGNYRQAYVYSNRYLELTDTILQESNRKQAEEMKAKYEADKQEQQIKDLRQERITADLQHAADQERQNKRLYIVIAASALGVMFSGFLVARYLENQKSRKRLQLAYNEIEEKNKNITDSIRYAQRIQSSILPNPGDFNALFPGSFVLYRPKDIVSGDFWWLRKVTATECVLAVADCTGHGVPGAFMSVMGADLLTQAAKDKDVRDPGTALHYLDEGVRLQLRQTGGEDESKDGMDVALLQADFPNKKVHFAGAMRPLFLVRRGEAMEFEAARFSIGAVSGGGKKFETQTIAVEDGDMLYMFTDGFSDQFGGPQGKKYKSARLKSFLVSIAGLPAEEQKRRLEKEFDAWKEGREQVDDVCIAGIRVRL